MLHSKSPINGRRFDIAEKSGGFTLIEAMITVAIIAIVAAIAYPTYQEQVIKARRTDATSSLMAVAQVLERCFTSFGGYNNNNCSVVSSGSVSTDSREGYYSIASTGLTATTFRLRATAQAGTTQAKDDVCENLFFENTGKQEAAKSDGTDTTELCWVD